MALSKRDFALLGGVALLYFLSAKLGLLLSLLANTVTLFWPPSGIALAALLLFGVRLWPAVLLGAWLANQATGFVIALEISIGNTLAAVLGCYLLRLFPGFNLSLISIRDIFILLCVAASASTLSALSGSLWLAANGVIPWPVYSTSALHWWMGDTLGIILFTPLLLAWVRHKPLPRTPAIRREQVAYFSILIVLCLAVFSDLGLWLLNMRVGPVVLLPVIIWAALRFNMRLTMLGAALVFLFSIVGMVRGSGAFAPETAETIREAWIYNLVLAVTGLLVTVTSYQRGLIQRSLQTSQENFNRAQSVAQIGSWTLDIPSNNLQWSEELYRMLGVNRAASLSYELFLACVHPDDRKAVDAAWQAALRHEPYDIEHRVVVDGGIHGQVRWVRERAQMRFDVTGQLLSVIGTTQDITRRKEAEKNIHLLAFFDVLTGLPNRTLLRDRMEQMLAAAHRDRHKFALLVLDLDRFKYVNDSMGHTVGDKLLQAVAQQMLKCVREGDTVARIGGDEFVVLLRETDADGAAHMADKLLQLLSAPYDVGGLQISPHASIGISIYPDNAHDLDTLLKTADVAMYRAKDEGRNNFQFFATEMNFHANRLFSMEKDLRLALQNNEFSLHYQPLVDLYSGAVCGAEALLRWKHPQQGFISPAEFIPVAEETGQILPIGEWVLRTACAQLAAWRKLGLPVFPLAVNLSIRQLRQANLVQLIAQVLEENGLHASDLELELTEGIMLGDTQMARAFLTQINERGIGLSIDDFGTGYSSLSYLKNLPVNKLKIDRSFVRDIATDANDAAIAYAIITLAHQFDLRVVAEGAETLEQVDFLRTRGCDEIQGYYYSRPLPADEFVRYLNNNPSLDAGLEFAVV